MIEVDGLRKTYGPVTAVDHVTFTAPAGQVTGFLGANGAGKSTTLRMLLGLARPDKGTAVIGGLSYAELRSPLSVVGAVLDPRFHPGRTARNHLRALTAAAGIREARVEEVLGQVGLSADAERRVGGYSTGMRQRLGIAAALLGDPQVFVLDEPSNGLDPPGIAWLRTMIRSWADEGRTVLVSSHVLAEIAQVIDRVAIIDRGRIVREGTLEEVAPSATGVRVRTPQLVRFAEVVRAAGWRSVASRGGVLEVSGASTTEIGQLAAGAGIELHELAPAARGERLEAVFLESTTATAEVNR